MISMVSAGDKARPILAYVRDLENLVRKYRAVERKWRFGSFALGMGAGAVLGFLVWRLLLH